MGLTPRSPTSSCAFWPCSSNQKNSHRAETLCGFIGFPAYSWEMRSVRLRRKPQVAAGKLEEVRFLTADLAFHCHHY